MILKNIALISVLIVVFILVFVYSALPAVFGRRKTGKKGTLERPGIGVKDRNATTPPGTKKSVPCPLCGSLLGEGERLKSRVYRAGTDNLSHITGCPYCAPGSRTAGIVPGGLRQPPERTCPVCRKTVPPEGYLVARMFERRSGGAMKTHVHILGCTECRRRNPGE